MRTHIVLALGLMLPAGAPPAATQEQIGSWVLSCPGATPATDPCLLRFERRLLDKAGITGDLEVRAEGTSLVPVITLRGLSAEVMLAASLAGKTEASMRFGDGPPQALECEPDGSLYVCSPRQDAARALAAGLPDARSVTVRVWFEVAGMKPLPVQEKSLDLSGTARALARLRAAGPSRVPDAVTALASEPPGALMAMADRALKAAGYPNGLADLRTLIEKYKWK